MTRKVIIDTDPGIDDAMAIHFAFARPDIDVLGLTTVFGNVHTDQATRNALALAEMAAYPCVVAPGADAPLARPLNDPADFVHGPEGFGDLPAAKPDRRPDARSAARFICDMAAAHPGEVTICALAPLTNLAIALEYDPDVARNIRDVIIMGGALDVPGNVSPFAEANIVNDPEAADRVFGADWPVTMVGLDITTTVRCTPSDFEDLRTESPRIGGFLADAAGFYFEFHRRQHDLNACYMHDPTVLIACSEPDVLGVEEVPLRVVTEGAQDGRTVRALQSGRRPVRVATGVDVERVRAMFLETVRNADACCAARDGA